MSLIIIITALTLEKDVTGRRRQPCRCFTLYDEIISNY